MQVPTNHIIVLIIAITLVFLIAGCFLLLYVSLYSQRKKKHLEEKQQMQQAFEKEAVNIQMEVQEQTLQTIASEIHDNVGQLLSLSKLTLSTINIQQAPEKAQQKVDGTISLLNTSIKELRHLASVLHAQNLLANGLEKAIENELSWISRSDQYKITWQPPKRENEIKIDPQKELIAFRLIQELINNILKHAEASEIIVNFESQGKLVEINIHDNGKGFDVSEAITKPSGLGISNLFKRAGMIGGELVLTSEKGKGTSATLRFPF